MGEHVAILIVGYRCADEIRTCLEAVAPSTHTDFEIHVCENGGPEAFSALRDVLEDSALLSPLRRAAARTPRVSDSYEGTFISGGQRVGIHQSVENSGYAGGVNTALDLIADPNWAAIWILNPDTQIDPNALEELLAHARSDRYGIVGSRLVLAETGRIQLYAGRWRKWLGRGFNIGLNEPADLKPDVSAIEQDMDYVSGASMLVTRAFVDEVGRMDESYFLYNEEVDWCFRRGSFRLGYAHDAIVHHLHGATMGSSHDKRDRSPLSVFLDERNKLLFSRRFFPLAYPIILGTTLLLTGQYLAAGAYANFRHALRGWWAGLLGRRGAPQAARPEKTGETSAPSLHQAKV